MILFELFPPFLWLFPLPSLLGQNLGPWIGPIFMYTLAHTNQLVLASSEFDVDSSAQSWAGPQHTHFDPTQMDKSSQVKARHPSVLCCVGWIDGCVGVTTTTTTTKVKLLLLLFKCACAHPLTSTLCLFLCFHINILCLSRKEHVPQGRTIFFFFFFFLFLIICFK
jgi:hypothetical protein